MADSAKIYADALKNEGTVLSISAYMKRFDFDVALLEHLRRLDNVLAWWITEVSSHQLRLVTPRERLSLNTSNDANIELCTQILQQLKKELVRWEDGDRRWSMVGPETRIQRIQVLERYTILISGLQDTQMKSEDDSRLRKERAELLEIEKKSKRLERDEIRLPGPPRGISKDEVIKIEGERLLEKKRNEERAQKARAKIRAELMAIRSKSPGRS